MASSPLIVSGLNIYPVKSLAGVSVNEALATNSGFALDRKWMLVNAENRFITQRQLPLMALLSPQFENGRIRICGEIDSITFEYEEKWGKTINSQVWDDAAITIEVNPLVSQWFSDALKYKVKLVSLTGEDGRMHESSVLKKKIPVSLADAYPYLVLGTKSVEFLNHQLLESIPVDRFRANILIETHSAHEEDQWSTYQLGNATFRSVKPCGRCTMITIDQKSGIQNQEPLKVLNTYRKNNHSVIFGMHTICLEQGIVKTGDILVPPAS